MKAGAFKLNMHPKEYFDRNPFRDDGKESKSRGDDDERSKSAPTDKKCLNTVRRANGFVELCFSLFEKNK